MTPAEQITTTDITPAEQITTTDITPAEQITTTDITPAKQITTTDITPEHNSNHTCTNLIGFVIPQLWTLLTLTIEHISLKGTAFVCTY